MFPFTLAVAAVFTSIAIQSALAIPTISVKGAKFFANGQQFYLKGVAYQGTPQDPLVDTNQCQLDATSMKAIGTNSVRVYHVNPWVNHDGCMSAFANAGIYIWLDLDTFNSTIAQDAPTWTQAQFVDFAKVMDVFQGYDNLGGFWIGNEVINTASGSSAAPFVKAAVADMKSYMAAKKYRSIPIGYSAADIAELRPMLQNYLACGSLLSQSIDFFGLNSYEWCGDATYTTSGYQNLQQMSENYSIPIFFSETGCNVPDRRSFGDQSAIFGPEMINTWSGSIIYEWVEETNHYGLVTYPGGQIYSGTPIPLSPDYQNLANVWKNINPVGVAAATYNPSFAAPACPLASGGWAVNGDVPLPTLSPAVVKALAASSVLLPTATPTPSAKQTSKLQPTDTSGSTSPKAVQTSVTSSSTIPPSSVVVSVTSQPPSSSEPAIPAASTSSSSMSSSDPATLAVSTSSKSTFSSVPAVLVVSTSSHASSTTAPSSPSSSAVGPSSSTSSLPDTPSSSATPAVLLSTTGLATFSRVIGTTSSSPTSAAAAATSSSAANSLMIQRRGSSESYFWSLTNMLSSSGWFVTIILPVAGVAGVVAFL